MSSENLSLCRHFDTNSDLVLSRLLWSAVAMHSFSVRQSAHRFELPVVAGVCLMMDQLMEKSSLSAFKSHTCLESAVDA